MSPLTDSSASQALALQRAATLGGKPETITAANPDDLAAKFEGFFYSLLIKEMRQTLEHGMFGEESSDAYGGLFDLYLGQHLGAAGGLGVSQYVSQYVNAANTDMPES